MFANGAVLAPPPDRRHREVMKNGLPPDHELDRSRAANWVGRQAARFDLPMSHFEYRVRLPLPDAWLPVERADLGVIPGWQSGRLAESKYQSYRHDLLVGSFHPSHRAKWTAHELMHGIQGFAWQAQGTPFFHAVAAWAAEILPVAIWYFFDEADLQRCAKHQGQGPLFGTYCVACERAAMQGAGAFEPQWWDRGIEFVRDQLAAVRRSLHVGQLQPLRYVTLDLASDGLAYAAAHTPRLNSDAFALLMERFAPTCVSLEAYLARIEALTQALVDGADLPVDTVPSWSVAQDLAWRLLTVHAQSDGEVAAGLLALVDDLAQGASPAATAQAYQALHDEWVLPPAVQVFGVGYRLSDALGWSREQIHDGLLSCLPRTCALLAPGDIDAFIDSEGLERVHLARRFAAFLRDQDRRGLADLAQLEAAMADPPKADLEALTLPPHDAQGPWRLGQGHEIVDSAFDLLTALDGGSLEPGACALLLVADAQGQVQLLELDAPTHAWLHVLQGPAPDPMTCASLIQLGVLVPERYAP